MQDHTHFIACMTSTYFESVEKQEGRPYQELKAATLSLPSHRIVCVYPEACSPISPQRVQQLPSIELRKAFVTKAQVRLLTACRCHRRIIVPCAVSFA